MTLNDHFQESEASVGGTQYSDSFIPVATPIDGLDARREPPSNPLLLETLSRSNAALHLAMLFALLLVSQVVAVLVLSDPTGDPESPTALSPLSAIVVTIAAGLVVVLAGVLLMRQAGGSAASIGISFRRWHVECAWGILVAISSFAVYFLTIGVIQVVWPAGIDQLRGNPERIKTIIPQVHVAWLVPMMVMVAVWEEAVFRGILVTHLRRITGGWSIAMVLSALFFAWLHTGDQEPVVAIPLFALALVWSLFMVWRRSIIAIVIGHALYNLGQLLAMEIISHSTP